MRDQFTQGQGRVLAITSGKGGVGKSNVAANVSVQLARMGKRVTLVDADMSLGNLDVILNVQSRFNLSHLVNGQRQMDEVVHAGPEGIQIVCAASGLEELANLNQFQQARLIREFSSLQAHTDALIVDTAAGIGRDVTAFCLAADQILLITTPDATAMTDAYGMIKVLTQRDYAGPINLVVNMVDTPAQGKRIYTQMAKVVRQFLDTSLYFAGTVLYDTHVVSAVRSRTPLVLAYPKSPAAQSIRQLATRIGNVTTGGMETRPFFKKVVNWFS